MKDDERKFNLLLTSFSTALSKTFFIFLIVGSTCSALMLLKSIRFNKETSTCISGVVENNNQQNQNMGADVQVPKTFDEMLKESNYKIQ